ncbi:MAG: DUF4914 family protein [Epulopiscium sp.]|nr:DUF4914 family protein [Candidatus Epulonipiscium sp.]
MGQDIKETFILSKEVQGILEKVKSITIPKDREHLLSLALGEQDADLFQVAYDVVGKGKIIEATVVKCKNGAAANYEDIYMRRRDSNSMVIGDTRETDKETYSKRYGKDLASLEKRLSPG